MLRKAFRYDIATMNSPHLDHRGYLRADARLARTGIQEYQMPDGSMRRELRPKDEVFSKDSLSTLSGSAVTNDHPPVPLDSKNTKMYAVGHLEGEPKQDGDYLVHSMAVTDERTIGDVMNKGKQQISQGYHCDVDMTPGVDEDYGPYDAIQRNIRHNHSAIVQDGRAGPAVKIKMDSVDGAEVEFGFCYHTDISQGPDQEDPDQEPDDDEEEMEEGDSYDEEEEGLEEDAKWSSSYKNNLPSSSYAYVDPKGKGHLPYKNKDGEVDLPHLRNALARLAQTEIPPTAKASAKKKLQAAAKKHGVSSSKKDGENILPVSKSNRSDKNKEKNSNQLGENFMPIVLKLDGLELQFPDTMAQTAQLIQVKLKEGEKLLADNKELATKLDATEKSGKAEIEKRDQVIADLKKITTDEKEMSKRVQERVDTLEFAKKLFEKETKLDELSTVELQKKIVEKCYPAMDLSKQDEAFIKGLASGLSFGFKTDASKALDAALGNLKKDAEAGTKTDEAIAKFHQYQRDAHKGAKPEDYKVKA